MASNWSTGSSSCTTVAVCESESVDSEEEEEDGAGSWDDWVDNAIEGEEVEQGVGDRVQCLFCGENRTSAASIFAHCAEQHSFDFVNLRRECRLGFYDCLRLINYIRSEVAANGPGHTLEALLQHFKDADSLGSSTSSSSGEKQNVDSRIDNAQVFGALWSDEKYLVPFLANDCLLYTFDYEGEDEDFENFDSVDDVNMVAESMRDINSQDYGACTGDTRRAHEIAASQLTEDFREAILATPPEIAAHASALLAEEMCTDGGPPVLDDDRLSEGEQLDEEVVTLLGKNVDGDGTALNTGSGAEPVPRKKKKGKVTFATVAEKEKLNINRSYFGSYSGFGIHREMLGDKVRTEAYQSAIVENPSLLNDSVVMDVGCGTGILSLFAAKAGARKVIAVDGSEKMTAVATQVAKVNGFLDESAGKEEQRTKNGVIIMVAGMIEELDLTMPVERNSVDVLVSEWMGYCLLFESMLGSVLYARDKWLKPGGAMLPDTASMYVAGFGKGGTSLSFWEDVYGFDMQCVGEEIVHDATQHPIIDVIPSNAVVTDTCLLKEFDLTSMKHDDVDYTADFHIKLLPSVLESSTEDTNKHGETEPRMPSVKNGELSGRKTVMCYGLVVWFDTGFTSRFCRERPVNLTTSPHTQKTHWSQTLLTFKEPITLCMEENIVDNQNFDKSRVGSDDFPAYSISGRVSIARSFRYRSIDISLETTALGAGNAVKSWPVQMFDI